MFHASAVFGVLMARLVVANADRLASMAAGPLALVADGRARLEGVRRRLRFGAWRPGPAARPRTGRREAGRAAAPAVELDVDGVVVTPRTVEPLPGEPRAPQVLAPPSTEEVLAALEDVESCAVTDASHRACQAALAVRQHRLADRAVIQALEGAITRPGRPGCVQRAAVDALVVLGSREAEAALRRVRALLRKRAEWDVEPAARALALEVFALAAPSRRDAA